jgi:aspartate kinase
MAVVVQKYGGSSVADVERIQEVADRVAGTYRSGAEVVVVVSAMGQTTDELVGLARQVTDKPPPREMDMLLTAGERVSMALLAIALDVRDVPAVSYTGSQAGILTDSSHGEARIVEITGERVKGSLADGKVVIVAGFQGVDPVSKEVTTLGRGGSDTTAVALAATLGAGLCEINTDVDGVFTADPRVVANAVRIDRIGYHEMYELASAGAGVLMPHSVDFAHRNGVPLHVRSSFSDLEGTWVTGDAPPHLIAGLAHYRFGTRGTVTLVGAGSRAAAENALEGLEVAGIPSELIESNELRTSLEVPGELVEDVVRLIHDAVSPPVVSGKVRA